MSMDRKPTTWRDQLGCALFVFAIVFLMVAAAYTALIVIPWILETFVLGLEARAKGLSAP